MIFSVVVVETGHAPSLRATSKRNLTQKTKFNIMTKLFKPFTLLSFFIACGLVLSACNKDEPPPIDEPIPYLTVGKDNVVFSTEANTETISISTNAGIWTPTVQGNATSWLSVIQNGNDLLISTSKSENFDTREGEIRVTAGTLSVTITVTQLGHQPALNATVNRSEIPTDGGEFSLTITGNVSYEINFDADWIVSQTQESSRVTSVTNRYYFTVPALTTIHSRQAEITVSDLSGELESTVILISQAGVEPVFTVEASQSSIASGGGEIILTVRSTVEYELVVNSPWLLQPVALGTTALNTHQYRVPVLFNVLNQTREANIVVNGLEGDFAPATVPITQAAQTGAFVIPPSSAELTNFNILSVFTDITATTLRPEFSTLEQIATIPDNFVQHLAFHTLNGTNPKEFRQNTFRAFSNPSDWGNRNRKNPLSMLDNPTGITVEEGEYLVVFVGNTHGRTVSLRVINWDAPNSDGWSTRSSNYPLTQGINRIRMTRFGGLVYVLYHVPLGQTAPPIEMHFASGRVNGFFDSQIHTQPGDWERLLAAAVDPSFDVLGRFAHLAFPTAAWRQNAATTGPALIDAYDEMVHLQMKFIGLEKFNRMPENRKFFHVSHFSGMWGLAANHRTIYNVNAALGNNSMLNVNNIRGGSALWLPAHETGHQFQTRPNFIWIGMTEVTVNLKPLYIQQRWGLTSNIDRQRTDSWNNDYERAFHRAFVENLAFPAIEDDGLQLVPMWQLHLYFANARNQPDTYKFLYERARTQPEVTGSAAQVAFVQNMSEITETNLLPFFENWGFLTVFNGTVEHRGTQHAFNVSQQQINNTRNHVEALGFPTPSPVIHYITDSNWTIFRDELPATPGTGQRNDRRITITGSQNVIAFEVYQGSELIFVASRAPFTLPSSAGSVTVYAVQFDGVRIPVPF